MKYPVQAAYASVTPQRRKIFCSESTVCSRDIGSRKFISGVKGKKPNSKKNVFQTLTTRSNHNFTKHCVEHPACLFILNVFKTKLAKFFIRNYCPGFESVMVDIIELSKEVSFNFWSFTFFYALRIAAQEYLTLTLKASLV